MVKEDQSSAQELWELRTCVDEGDDESNNADKEKISQQICAFYDSIHTPESVDALSMNIGCPSPRSTPPRQPPEYGKSPLPVICIVLANFVIVSTVAERHSQHSDTHDVPTNRDLLLACDNGSPDPPSEESDQSSIASSEAASSRSSVNVESTEASSVDSGSGSDDEPVDGAWPVRRVVDQRFRNGRKQYKLDWAPTWEGEENCDCHLFIEEFEQKRGATSDTPDESRVQKRRRVTSR